MPANPPNTSKGTKLGPRVTVKVGKGIGTKQADVDLYSYMLKSTAEYFGIAPDPAPTKTTKKGYKITIRGSKGANWIKIPTEKKTSKGYVQYLRIPMPMGMTVEKITDFLSTKITKNKPDTFITKDGWSRQISTATDAAG